jgi:hypothetical protein
VKDDSKLTYEDPRAGQRGSRLPFAPHADASRPVYEIGASPEGNVLTIHECDVYDSECLEDGLDWARREGVE